jgi:outer membrane biosynthesis protein TonB
MRGLAKHSGRKCAAVAAVLGLLAWALPVWAADYEVRMPVEKTARIAPVGEASAESDKTDQAKPDKAAKPEKSAPEKQAKPAEKPGKPGEKPAKPAEKAAKPEKPAKEKQAKPAKDVPAPTAEARREPELKVKRVSESSIAKSPAPAVPKIDPKAAAWPADQTTQPAATLPGEGHWVGDVSLEFQEHAVVLHVATNVQAERVTWFNLAPAEGPRKLAVDLRGNWRKKGGALLRCDSGPVKAVVSGEHEDRLRLAVEFRDGAVAQTLEPSIESDPRGLSVHIPLAVPLKR